MAIDAGNPEVLGGSARLQQRVDQLCAGRQRIEQFTSEMLDGLRNNAIEHAVELATVRDQLESLQIELIDRNRAHEVDLEKLGELHEQLSDKKAELVRTRDDLTRTTEALKGEARQLADDLRVERDQLRDELAELRDSYGASQADRESLGARLATSQQQEQERNDENAQLRAEVERTAQQVAEIEAALTEACEVVNERDSLSERLAVAETRACDLVAQLDSVSDELASAHEQLQAALAARHEVEQSCELLQTDHAVLEDTLETARAQIATLEADVALSRGLEQELENAGKARQDLESRLVEQVEELEAVRSELTEVQAAHASVNDEHGALKSEYEQTCTRLEQAHIAIADLETLKTDAAQRDDLAQQLTAAEAHKLEVERQLNDVRGEFQDAAQQLKTSESARAQAEEYGEELLAEQEALRDELDAARAATGDRDELAQQLVDAETRKREADVQLQQLRDEIEDAVLKLNESDTARAQAEHTSEEIVAAQLALREELDEARRALEELDDLRAAAENRETLAQQLADAEMRQLEVERQLEQLGSEFEEARQKLEVSEAGRAQAEQHGEDLVAKQDALREELDDARRAQTDLDAVRAAAGDRDQLVIQLADAEAHKLEVEQQLAQLCYEMEDADRKRRETETARTEVEAENSRLASEKAALQDELDHAHQALADLTHTRAATEDHDELAQQLADAETRERHLQSQLDQLSRDAGVTIRELQESTSTLSETSHENERLQAACTKLSEELEEAAIACSEAVDTSRQYEADHANLCAQLELARQQLEELDQAREAGAQSDALRNHLQASETDKGTLQRELHAAQQRIAELEAAHDAAAQLPQEPTGDASVDSFMQQVKQLQRDAARRREQRSTART